MGLIIENSALDPNSTYYKMKQAQRKFEREQEAKKQREKEEDRQLLHELVSSVKIMAANIASLNEAIFDLTGTDVIKESVNKDDKDIVLNVIIQSTVQYMHAQAEATLEGEGPDTNTETIRLAQEIIMKTGFASVQVENKRAFLYVLEPLYFTKDARFWKWICDQVKDSTGYNLAIGKFSLKKESKLYGKFINSQAMETLKKEVSRYGELD